MDRLVCGDVGYGKTEVAMRAAFKAVHGRQAGGGAGAHHRPGPAALRTPSASASPAIPVRVEMLSRFRSPPSSRRPSSTTWPGARSTSSSAPTACSREDVAFKDLGLVVIDEEQRFGVTHKEQLKLLSQRGRADPDRHAHPAHPAPGAVRACAT